MPPEVGRDPVARTEWDRVVGILTEQGTLTAGDGAALAIYCEAHARSVRAQAMVVDQGDVIQGRNGLYPNPWTHVKTAADKLKLAILRDFGLTPKARKNVTAANHLDDPLTRFLKGAS